MIAYDRLIDHPSVYYITFDNKEVGRMQARAVLAVKPHGNYAMIKGSPTDPNADFLCAGQKEVLATAIESGAIKIAGEEYTDGWQPAKAQKNMEQILTRNNNKIDAVVASNDGTAGGVVAALDARASRAPCRCPARTATTRRSTASRSAPRPCRCGRTPASSARRRPIAALLADGKKMSDVPGVTKFTGGPKKVDMNALLLTPIPITKDNLAVVIDARWIKKDELAAA